MFEDSNTPSEPQGFSRGKPSAPAGSPGTNTRAMAVALATRGFRVFRIAKGTKKHFIDSDWATSATCDPWAVWERFSDAATGESTDCNIGILGGGIVVIDVDVPGAHHKKDGRIALHELKAAGLDTNTLTVRTAGGGLHLYYNTAGKVFGNKPLAPGLEVKCYNGYVIGPGSTFDGGTYEIVNDVEPIDVPEILAQRLAGVVDRSESGPAVIGELDTDAAIAGALEYLSKQVPAVEGENGDNHTYRVCCGVLDFGLTVDTALDVMAEWDATCSPPWGEDLRRKLENAATHRQNPIGKNNPLNHYDAIDPALLAKSEPAASVQDLWLAPDLSVMKLQRAPAPRFPVEAFGSLAPWLAQSAKAKGSPVDYVGAGVLVTCAALIGMTRKIQTDDNWSEPCILWGVAVGSPSTNKSPGMDAALEPLGVIESRLGQQFATAMREYEHRKMYADEIYNNHQADVRSAAKSNAEPPPAPIFERPSKPVRPRVRSSDATVEALAVTLSQWPRGLLLSRDELAGLIGNFDRYGGKGGDRAFMLEGYGARRFTVDRRKDDGPIEVPHVALSMLGGIQPDRMHTLLMKDDDDGFLARMLMFWPDPVPIARARGAPNKDTIERAYERLHGLRFGPGNSSIVVPLDAPAADLFFDWRKRHAAAANDASGLHASALGKMPGQVLRIALVLELLAWAAGLDAAHEPTRVSVESLRAATGLIDEYFKPMLRRVMREAGSTDRERAATAFARKIAKLRPPQINLREVRREWGLPGAKIGKPGEASVIDGAARELVEAGWLKPLQSEGPGRPAKDYTVNPRVLTLLADLATG